MTDASTAQQIGALVREERRQQGMDQKTLALVANVGEISVHNIERGKETIRLDTLQRVLTALGLRIKVERSR